MVITVKRSSLFLVIMALPSAGAFAQSKPLTFGMSCSEAKFLVTSRGAIVLSTGQYAYDRYVSSQASCLSGQFTRPAWVPTADAPQCFVGYTCVDSPPGVGRLIIHDQEGPA
jgi:hypothetical protein